MQIAIHQPRVSYYVGGGEIVPLEQAKRLSQKHKVCLVTTARPRSDVYQTFRNENPQIDFVELEMPGTIYEQPAGHSQARWDNESLAFGKKTLEFYRSNPVDLIVTHYTIDSLLLAEGNLGNKNILHLHGVPHQYREIDAEALKVPNGFVSVSDFVGREWEKMHGVENVRLCYNGVDEKRFTPTSLEVSQKDIDLLYIGRLIEIKGIDTLIEAISQVAPHIPKIKAVIAGKGPDQDRLQKLVSQLGLTQNIQFAGYVPDSQLTELYNSAKLAVFPSYAKEGVLTTLLESSSCELPAVTSDCCGMVEFVDDDFNGRLFEPKNQHQLAEIILELLSDPAQIRRLGQNARNKILENWTWEKRCNELDEIYTQFVTGNIARAR